MRLGHRHEDVDHVDPQDRRVAPPVDAYATHGWLIAFGLLAALVGTGFVGWLVGSQDEERVEEDTGVTLAAVVADPDRYLGEVVTVRGEVREVVSPVLFVAGSEDELGSVLVHSTELPTEVVPGTAAEITGEVDMVDDEFIADYGPFEGDASIDVGTAVIVDAAVDFDVES